MGAVNEDFAVDTDKPRTSKWWWDPTGFTSPSCKIDFREDGKYIRNKERSDV